MRRYIDLKIKAAISNVDPNQRRQLSHATIAVNALKFGRYIAWSDRRNSSRH